MKVAVINPSRVNGFPVCREDRLEYIDYGEIFTPLTLLYTAAILEKDGFEVMMIDANGWDINIEEVSKKIRKFKPDLLLTRFAIDTIKQDAKVIGIAKQANPKCFTAVRSKIITDSDLLKKEVFANYPVDFLVVGDMEVIIPQLAAALSQKKDPKKVKGLMYLQNKKINHTGKASRIKDINKLPYPAYHLSGGISCYRTGTQTPPFTNIFSSRGCPYHCRFCSSHDTYQPRNPQNVVDEMEWLIKNYNLKNFYFFDDIFTIDKKRAEGICREMIKRKLKLRWSCGTRVDCVNTELLNLMKKAGCWMIAFGVESGNQEILNKNSKGFTLAQAEKAVKQTQKAGIAAYTMFVLGLPGETQKTIKNTFKFVEKLNPDYAQYCVAVPFPNTPFFDEYHKNNWITTYDWSKYNPLGKPTISTPEISDKMLEKFHYQGYRKFLLRPKFLLSRISLRNWQWNLIGLQFLVNRFKAIFGKTIIR